MNSIGIRRWVNGMGVEEIGSAGEGDRKVTAWRRSDGQIGLETNGDPVVGVEAEEWVGEFLPEAAERMMASERHEAESESGTK